MSATEPIIAALERNWDMIDASLEGVDDATIARFPADQCNSIAWILWHMSRVVDSFIQDRLQSNLQLWMQDAWYRRFAMGDDPDDRGFGWSYDRVKAWVPPSRDTLVEYYEAVKASSRKYLSSLSDAELQERRVIPPAAEPRTVGAALGQMVWESVAHGGQIAYISGFYRGMGWHR